MIGQQYEPIHMPANSTLTVMGPTSKIPYIKSCLIEMVEHSNVPNTVVINRGNVHPRAH